MRAPQPVARQPAYVPKPLVARGQKPDEVRLLTMPSPERLGIAPTKTTSPVFVMPAPERLGVTKP